MKELLKIIFDDLAFYSGSTFGKKVMTFFFKPAFRLMRNYRLGNYFFYHRSFISGPILIYLKHRQLKYNSCQISYETKIGRKLNLPHPVGIVIGKGVQIDDNVSLYQNCTLGRKRGNEYPHIKKGVTIYPSSIIVGSVIIGEGATIGALSFVNKSIKSNQVYFNKA
ncbi:serine O-acetyltransferase [Roseivirga pacifica]|uniref:Serine acetyltransferase n=1 Tax=Roseivirga pacifica TaxID=1267423 RepID=A0A1I0QZK9_9BACT|nr:hypothetical protein [Roseivirga pacifica]RKQ42309.1 serine O-acetyltransferase [Roseivirga pacifica]SEW33138.1 serine O-acetyltransferase [Roseivirga pacifica]